MIKTVMLDVDGVIADFTGHALRWFGRPDLIDCYPVGEYSIPKVLGIPACMLYRVMDREDFWTSVPRYRGAEKFVQNLDKACGQLHVQLKFCSVGTRCQGYPGGRGKWLRELCSDLGVNIPMIFMADHEDKAMLAGPETLFIDDNDLIVEQVCKAGSPCIQVPQLWNKLAMRASDPIDYDNLLTRVVIMCVYERRPA